MSQTGLLLLLIALSNSWVIQGASIPDASPSFLHKAMQVFPLKKIEEVQQEHLQKDEGFKAAVLYLQSEEWKKLVNSVLRSPQFLNFANMTQKVICYIFQYEWVKYWMLLLQYKLNITQTVECLKNHITSLKITGKVEAKPNLEPFIMDVHKAVPLVDLIKVLSTKGLFV